MNPEELQSYSAEQRQIRQVWGDLKRITEEHPPRENTNTTRYFFTDDEYEENKEGRFLNISYVNYNPDQEIVSGSLFSESTSGFDQVASPFFEIESSPNHDSLWQTPFGLLSTFTIDPTDNLFVAENSYIFDEKGQAFKQLYVGSVAYEGDLAEQLEAWGVEEDEVDRTDKYLSDTNQLVNISGSDLEQVKYLLSLIKNNDLVYRPDPLS